MKISKIILGMNNQFSKSVLYVYKLFSALLRKKWNFKFLLAFMKRLLHLKILTETLFKMLFAVFRKPPVIL